AYYFPWSRRQRGTRGRRRAADPGYRAAMSTVVLKAGRSPGPRTGQARGDPGHRTRGVQARDGAVQRGALDVPVELGGGDPGYRAAMSTVELKARRSLGPGSGQASGDRDLRTRGEQPRDRAVHLGALHVLVELGGVHPRHLTDRVQLDPGDGRTLVLALQ